LERIPAIFCVVGMYVVRSILHNHNHRKYEVVIPYTAVCSRLWRETQGRKAQDTDFSSFDFLTCPIKTVKMSLRLTMHHAMKMYTAVVVYFHAFLISALMEASGQIDLMAAFTPGKE